MLAAVAEKQYLIKNMPDDQIKIQPTSALAYSIIVKKLQDRSTEFHIFKPKKEKSFSSPKKSIPSSPIPLT